MKTARKNKKAQDKPAPWVVKKLQSNESEIGCGGVYGATAAIFQEGNPIYPDEKSLLCRFYGRKP